MKRFLLIFAFVLAAFTASAQLGIKGGMNFHNFGDISNSFNSKTGCQFGILYKIQIPLIGLAIQPEFLYSESSTRYRDYGGDRTCSNQSIMIPVHFQFGLDLVMLRPFLQFSPYVKYNMGTAGWFGAEGTSLKQTNYGVGAGGGLDIWRFQVALSYYWDLTNVAHNNQGGAHHKTAKTKGLSLSFAYFF